MFKRFHEKKQDNSRQTYQQLQKIKSAVHTAPNSQYARRNRNVMQPIPDEVAQFGLFRTQEFLFQGATKAGLKHGPGALFLKNGAMLFGRWAQDQLEGRAIIFTAMGSRILAHFAGGKLNGWSMALYGDKIVKCVKYYENLVDGEKLTYDQAEELWVAARCAPDGKLLAIAHVEKGSRVELPHFIQDEELRALLHRFLILREEFLPRGGLAQLEINGSTNYIGYVDEEGRPCGLGTIYSEQEIYSGNFFEGALEHYGRMLFGNGEIYHGEMIGGVFWANGLYYSPTKNSTTLLLTDEYEQHIQQEFTGYVLLDIPPPLGQPSTNNHAGFFGLALPTLMTSMEPYYKRQFIENNLKQKQNSNHSDYGKSEEMNNSREGRGDLASPQTQPRNKPTPPQKWLRFGEEQLGTVQLRRSQSLDKREVAAMKKNNIEVKIKAADYESAQIRQNQDNQQAENFMRQSPSKTQLMQQIPFGGTHFQPPHKESRSLELDQLHFRNNPTLQSLQDNQVHLSKAKDMKEAREREVREVDMSEEGSQASASSQQLRSLLDRNRSQRKRIFY